MGPTRSTRIVKEAAPQHEVAGAPEPARHPGAADPRGVVLALQRASGNRAVTRLLRSRPTIRRQAVADAPAAGTALLVDDTAPALGSGQMRVGDFLREARGEVCRAVEEIIAPTGRSTDDCPYLGMLFPFLERRGAAYVERAVRRFAPELRNAAAAGSYVPFIVARAREAARTWVRTGRIRGLPEGIPTSFLLGAAAPGLGNERPAPATVQLRGGGATVRGAREARARLGPGRPLDAGIASRMGAVLGADLSRVRAHTDVNAAALARRLDARAFTVGEHVAFGAGEYRPGTLIGDALIAHELAHVVQQQRDEEAERGEDAGGESHALEGDAERSAAGTVASLWSGLSAGMADVARQAVPRLRSGLRLQRCKASRRCRTSGEEYHGVGGWLHCYVYESLQEDYASWKAWAENLMEEWGEEVPVLGHLAGGVVGFVPWWLGTAGEAVVAVPQFLTPKTQEEHFITVMTFGTGTPAVRAKDGVQYGYWWMKNLFKKNPAAEQELLELGAQGVDEALEAAARKAPEPFKQVPAKTVVAADEAAATKAGAAPTAGTAPKAPAGGARPPGYSGGGAGRGGGPPKGGQDVLVVGGESEAEFAYASELTGRGQRVTVINPERVTKPAETFRTGGGDFRQVKIEELPRKPTFDLIREDYPYPLGRAGPLTADMVDERLARLRPGGSWHIVTEDADFAGTLKIFAERKGAAVRTTQSMPYHEGLPQSAYPKRPERFVLIVEKPAASGQ